MKQAGACVSLTGCYLVITIMTKILSDMDLPSLNMWGSQWSETEFVGGDANFLRPWPKLKTRLLAVTSMWFFSKKIVSSTKHSSIHPLTKHLVKGCEKLLSQISFILVSLYRGGLSIFFGSHCCRFYPSCSVYAQGCFERFPFFTAFHLVFKRLLKCRPFGPYGDDAIPFNKEVQK